MNVPLPVNLLRNSENKKNIFTTQEELTNYILDKIDNSGSDMTEEEKAQMSARIDAKLKAGKKLTPEEEDFLRKNNPQLYMQYKRIRAMAEQMAQQLKQAKTKQEANGIITSAMAGVSHKDPYKEQILAAMNEVAKEFKKTAAYNRLPENDADKKRKTDNTNEDFLDKAEDKEDLSSWTPLQEIIDAMPSFNSKA